VVPEHGTAGRACSTRPDQAAGLRRLRFPSFAMRQDRDSGASETRNPMLLFSFVGLLLLRFAACRLLSLLLNDPPRGTSPVHGAFAPQAG